MTDILAAWLVFAITLSICGLTFAIMGINDKESVKQVEPEPTFHPMQQLPIKVDNKDMAITIHVAGNKT